MTPHIHILSTYPVDKELSSRHLFFSFSDDLLFDQVQKNRMVYVEKKAKLHEFMGKETDLLEVEFLQDRGEEHAIFVGLGEKRQVNERLLRDQVANAIRFSHSLKSEKVVIHTNSAIESIPHGVETLVEGVLLGDYSFDIYKGKESKKHAYHAKDVYVVVSTSILKIAAAQAEKGEQKAQSVLLARDLINMPASHLHPEILVSQARSIEKMSKGAVTVEVLDEAECKRLGMGAFLGVAEGSERKPAFIVLKYKGNGTKNIALVGKSITFDSGGLSLKPSEAMMDMKIDMAGGAAVLGVFQYLSTAHPLVSFKEVYGVLPACENMPSGKAIKPGDIVTALNGKTIEVLNTDAEGRLTLADALVYAENQLRADYCIDLATLTGACMVALGADLSGLFSNDESFDASFGKCAKRSGDDYWKLPLYVDYAKQIKSDIADLKNIGGGRYGGAITAALFLREFVQKMKWLHIDIAGPAYREQAAKGALSKGATGWGVLAIINLLESSKQL